jgi:hypothetical protein
MCGRRLSSTEFVERIEHDLNRRIKPPQVDRPRKGAKWLRQKRYVHIEIGI